MEPSVNFIFIEDCSETISDNTKKLQRKFLKDDRPILKTCAILPQLLTLIISPLEKK